jgi:hypothetical protein
MPESSALPQPAIRDAKHGLNHRATSENGRQLNPRDSSTATRRAVSWVLRREGQSVQAGVELVLLLQPIVRKASHHPVRLCIAILRGLFLTQSVLPPAPRLPAMFLVLAAVISPMVLPFMTAAVLPPVMIPLEGAPEVKGAAAGPGPALYAFLPGFENNTGCAVLILPSGGPKAGEIAGAGTQMARWLNERGIAGFVLRYHGQPQERSVAVSEASRAVSYLRAHAGALGISPRRIGALGFAAGADLAADLAYHQPPEAGAGGNDSGGKVSSRPDFVALIWGSSLPGAVIAAAPPAFLVGSTAAGDGLSGMIDLWTQLRTAHVPVDAHFFVHADPASGLAQGNPSLGAWPGMFQAWLSFSGFMTDAPRVAIKGLVFLDGRVLPHGYVIFTPLDFVGAGPVVGRVINSTAGVPLGEFSLPADQGPVAGRYRVDVRQNMNRWLSNSFSGDLVNVRGAATPAQSYFGHHRLLAPSIDDQRSYTKVHPSDREDYIVEFKPGAGANLDLKIDVFSK